MKPISFPLNKYFFETPIAHRGLHEGNIDENSLTAYQKAIDKGYAIEIDVHIMKDEKLLIHHDGDIKRITGVDLKIADLVEEDLEKYPMMLSKEKIPTLKEFLKLVNGQVPVLIEIKIDGEFTPRICEVLLEDLKDYPKKEFIALQSFHPYAVKYLKEHTDEYSVGQLATRKYDGYSKFIEFMLSRLMLFKKSHADFISYDITGLPFGPVKRLHKKYPLLCWTIDTYEKYEKAKQFADNIIFEYIKLDK